MTLEELSYANFYLTILSIIVTTVSIGVAIFQASGAKKYARKALMLTERDRSNEAIILIQNIRNSLVNIQTVLNPNRNKGENPIGKVNEFGADVKRHFNELKKIFPDSQVDLLNGIKKYNMFIDLLINAKKVREIKLEQISDFESYLDEIQNSMKRQQAENSEDLS